MVHFPYAKNLVLDFDIPENMYVFLPFLYWD